ncbi:MAG: Uma2 family endonuclease [Acidobacteria bacterium]|nr:Uma2 family endonuclease [Acidobacteriota bacterium]
MASQLLPRQLITGQRMDREEFLRVWEQLPDIKHAELIDGVVYVSSPISRDHGTFQLLVGYWLSQYAASTPVCEVGGESTWMMLESAPQPDVYLYLLPEFGGQSGYTPPYSEGAPELAVEICVSSTDYDFGPKLALYQRAGVKEYITVETFAKRITWRVLIEGSYVPIQPDADRILRSRTFPGLWLDETAFRTRDRAGLTACLQRGVVDAAHAAFLKRLRAS